MASIPTLGMGSLGLSLALGPNGEQRILAAAGLELGATMGAADRPMCDIVTTVAQNAAGSIETRLPQGYHGAVEVLRRCCNTYDTPTGFDEESSIGQNLLAGPNNEPPDTYVVGYSAINLSPVILRPRANRANASALACSQFFSRLPRCQD